MKCCEKEGSGFELGKFLLAEHLPVVFSSVNCLVSLTENWAMHHRILVRFHSWKYCGNHSAIFGMPKFEDNQNQRTQSQWSNSFYDECVAWIIWSSERSSWFHNILNGKIWKEIFYRNKTEGIFEISATANALRMEMLPLPKRPNSRNAIIIY